jgi:hypothetical protein
MPERASDLGLTLMLGGTGKTGRRIVQRLTGLDLPVPIGSRTGGVPFDWADPVTRAPALGGARAAYVLYDAGPLRQFVLNLSIGVEA